MRTHIGRLGTFTLISLLSLLSFAALAGAQDDIVKQPNASPMLMLRGNAGDPHQIEAKTEAAYLAGVPSTYTEKVIYSFCPAPTTCPDGYYPYAGLIQDTAGNLYGAAALGGKYNFGAVYKVDTSGNETVLYSFCPAGLPCTDGAFPRGSLIMDSAGNLYGTTYLGGANSSANHGTGGGTVFKLAPAQGGGPWTETVLYSFCSESNCTDGEEPASALIMDAAGNLYGTTPAGGANTAADGGTGGGTVFELDTTGHETVLYSFCSQMNCADGYEPEAGLIEVAGNFYGTTAKGGADNGGTVFEVEGVGQETVLYSFCSVSRCTDGDEPTAALIQDLAGNLYSTTGVGGANGAGTIFELHPGTPWTETVLYSFCSFPKCADGAVPAGGVIRDKAGNLYGTAADGGNLNSTCVDSQCGTAFELDTTGHYTVLYSFCSATNCTDGDEPVAGLIQDSAGNLFGTTIFGGNSNSNCSLGSCGTVFELVPGGGGGPTVTLSPTSLKFGKTLVGKTSAAKKVTLTNSGTATLDITTIAISGDFALATVKKTKKVTPCVDGGTVAAGASCEIAVTFTPQQTGTLTGDVTFTDNAGNSPQQLPLTGTGKN